MPGLIDSHFSHSIPIFLLIFSVLYLVTLSSFIHSFFCTV